MDLAELLLPEGVERRLALLAVDPVGRVLRHLLVLQQLGFPVGGNEDKKLRATNLNPYQEFFLSPISLFIKPLKNAGKLSFFGFSSLVLGCLIKCLGFETVFWLCFIVQNGHQI